MSRLRLWTLLSVGFVAIVVGSAFATDALHDDASTKAAAYQPIEMPADEIEVLAPVFVAPVAPIGPNGDLVRGALPDLLAEDFIPQPSGMRVLMPPDELWESPTEQEVVDNFNDLVDRVPPDFIDEDGSSEDQVAFADAAEPLIDAPAAPDLRGFVFDAARGIAGFSDGNRSRFFDPCALLGDGCVFGLPAVVTLDTTTIPFRMDFDVFGGASPRRLELCPPQYDSDPARFHVSVRTTVPAAIHLRYVKQGQSADVIDANFELPANEDIERLRWQSSVDDGTFDLGDPSTCVRRCTALILEPGGMYVFEPVRATAADGRVLALQWTPTLQNSAPADPGSRPPTKVTPTSDNHIEVEVWSRNPAAGYQTVAIAIPQGGSEQRSCTDYESNFVGLTRDFVIDESHAIYHEQPSAQAPNEWQWRHTIGLSLLEGTHYSVCTWEVWRADRTFDAVRIQNRDQVDVVTPNRHRVAVSVDQIRLDRSAKDQFVVADAGQSCDIYGPRLPLSGGGLAAGGTSVSEGRTVVNKQFCATDGSAPRRAIYTRVSVGYELFDRVHEIVALPFDVNSGCEIGGTDSRCSNSFSKYFTLDSTALCGGTCGSLRVVFRLDYLPSNGAGTERWQVGDAATFAATSVQDPNLPQVDLNSLHFATSPDLFGATITFQLNHPADYDITLITGQAECDRQVTGTGEGLVERIIDDLCPDSFYRITSIRLTDADGKDNEQYPIGGRIRDSIYTVGWASSFDAYLRLDSVTDESLATARCQAIDNSSGQDYVEALVDRCWEHLSASGGLQVEIGGFLAQSQRLQHICASDFEAAVLVSVPPRSNENPAFEVVHGNLIEVSGSLLIDVDSNFCWPHSAPAAEWPFPAIFSEIELGFEVPQTSLDQPVHLALESDGLAWDLEIIRTDLGIAPGDG